MKGIEQFVQVDAATLGALKYAGTWNASTNTPTLASGVGVQGQYYVVSVAGTTNLDGVTNWGVGDWAVFNGTVWQRVEGGADGNFVNLSVTGTATVSGTAEFADGLAASPSITNIGDTNTGMYFPSADAIGIVTGGVNRIRVTSAGDVGIGTTSPASKLDVNGTVTATGATVTGNTYLSTTSGDVGIGTTSPVAKLDVRGASGGILGQFLENDSGNSRRIRFSISGNVSNIESTASAGATNLAFAVDGTERMRIDSSGNVGIGTSSPTTKLHVNTGAAGYGITVAANSQTSITYQIGIDSSSNLAIYDSFAAAKRLVLDTSGNLGLGVTPSAWSTQNAVEFSYGAFSAGTAIGTLMASNAFYNGTNWIYRISSAAMRYTQDSAGHSWYTAPFGTAGSAISFTQAMTLDTSGNLLVGTTANTESAKLNVQGGYIFLKETNGGDVYLRSGFGAGTDPAIQVSSNDPLLFVTNNTERARIDSAGNLGLGVTPSASDLTLFQINAASTISAANNEIDISQNAVYSAGWKYITSSTATRYQQYAGSHAWYTAGSGTAGNAISFTQSMTLDLSGNLGLGTTSPVSYANYVGMTTRGTDGAFSSWASTDGTKTLELAMTTTSGYLKTITNHPLYFATNNTERARITSGGDLLVGTTDNSVTAGAGTKISTGANPRLAIVTDSSTSNTAISLYSTGAAAYRFFVDPDGTVYATNTTISAISDQRFKENVRDLDVGLNAIMALKPRKFDWKAGKGKDIKDDRGFIAQELEQVFPDLVDEWKDPAPEGEEPYKSVRQDLIPVLVKAIQELKAEVDSLKAQLGA